MITDRSSNSLPVITVTLTPAVDVSLGVSCLQPGILHRVPGVRQDPGGKGINVSKALHSFGVPTLATGFLGGNRGRWIETQLEEAGMLHQFVHTEEETRMNVKVSEENGRLTEFNSPSQVRGLHVWRELEILLTQLLVKEQWITLCGRLPDEVSPDWYATTIHTAKEIGAKTVLDVSGEGFARGVQAAPDIVKPNRMELSSLFGQDLQSIDELVSACQELLDIGVQSVVVSLGEEGLIGVTRGEFYTVTVPKVTVGSAVGAGDTLVAGLLYGIYHHLSFPETLRFAAASGTAATGMPGTKQPILSDVEFLLPQVKVVSFQR